MANNEDDFYENEGKESKLVSCLIGLSLAVASTLLMLYAVYEWWEFIKK